MDVLNSLLNSQKNALLILYALLAVYSIFITGCGNDSGPQLSPTTGAESTRCSQPVKIAFLIDLTVSGKEFGVALPDRQDLSRLVDIVRTCTGELAIGTVESAPKTPLVRLRIEPSKQSVTEPKREDFADPFRYNDALAAYRRNAKAREAAEERRQKQITQNTQDFLDEAGRLLADGATHQRSDIHGALRRSRVFLEESTDSWSLEPALYALLLSDGQHNRTGSRKEAMPTDVTTLIIFGSSDAGVLAGIEPPPLRFESVNAAISHIKSQEVN